MLSMTSQGCPWVGLQTPTLFAGVSADVGPLGGPPDIGLKAASLLAEKKRKKRGVAPLALYTLPTLFALGLGSRFWHSPWTVVGIPRALLE
jgi:hypothetical protein